jgi:hypothetical protein
MKALIAAALVAAALGIPGAARSQAVLGEDPLAPRYFSIEWALDPANANISGYVYNQYGQTMGAVRLVVEMLDGEQNVQSRRYEWLGRPLSPFSRSYFQVKKLPPATSYRVAVNSYTIIESGRDFP